MTPDQSDPDRPEPGQPATAQPSAVRQEQKLDADEPKPATSSGAWFLKEVEKTGRTSIVPANNAVLLIALVVLLGTISTSIGGMTLMMAQDWLPGAAALAVAACLIALIWYGLTKKTVDAPAD